ncbi:MAG: GNAT family N-acetyltransferase [Firmicutes bacterium]|nr:GNAT family N-acetyltransferase [Bacillota bacterium]
MGIDIRQIVNRAELEACYDLWGAVFNEGRAFFQQRLDADRTYRLDTTWAAWVDGVMAAAIQIFPFWVRYGVATVRVAGIGSVATRPEYRHRGLAQAILRQQLSWMKAHDYPLALLYTHLPGFYAQLGWIPFREGESYRYLPGQVLAEKAPPISVDVGDLGRDAPVLRAIYDDFSAQVPFSRVRSAAFWEDMRRWTATSNMTVFIAKMGEAPVGYLLARERPTWQEPAIECAYTARGQHSALPLLQAYLRHSHRTAPLTLRLPKGHALARYGTPTSDASGAMWRLVLPLSALQQLQPEFNRRWLAEPTAVSTALALAVGSQILCCFDASPDGLDIRAQDCGRLSAEAIVSLTDAQCAALLLFGADPQSPAFSHRLFQILFPPTVPFLWDLDHF